MAVRRAQRPAVVGTRAHSPGVNRPQAQAVVPVAVGAEVRKEEEEAAEEAEEAEAVRVARVAIRSEEDWCRSSGSPISWQEWSGR